MLHLARCPKWFQPTGTGAAALSATPRSAWWNDQSPIKSADGKENKQVYALDIEDRIGAPGKAGAIQPVKSWLTPPSFLRIPVETDWMVGVRGLELANVVFAKGLK
jgi:hypothetical protein